MSRALIFWVLMLIWFVFKLAVFGGVVAAHYVGAGDLLAFILFLLLGWAVYGPPVHG